MFGQKKRITFHPRNVRRAELETEYLQAGERRQAAGRRITKAMDTREPDFPNLTKMHAYDRQLHIERCLEMGMTRAEAEAHADEDMADGNAHLA